MHLSFLSKFRVCLTILSKTKWIYSGNEFCFQTCDDSDADAVDSSDEDDANKSWLGDAPPALRIYYGDAVMPHQGRGAKVLGHIKTSLGVFAMAKPRDSSQSEDEESSNGCVVVLSKVTFM